jgi:hypothetical protein
MNLKEIGYEGVDWIHPSPGGNLRRDVVNAVMNLRVHKRRVIS